MEKLLQFINEYYESKNMYRGLLYYDQEDGYFTDHSRYDIHHSFIISKKFGFIQWLVDTEQFDYGKVGEIVDEYKGSLREKAYVVSDCEYESMLMLLAIQDDPIEFLVSVLK